MYLNAKTDYVSVYQDRAESQNRPLMLSRLIVAARKTTNLENRPLVGQV